MQSPLEKKISFGYNSLINFQNSLNNLILSTNGFILDIELIFIFRVYKTICSNNFLLMFIILTKRSITLLWLFCSNRIK